MSPSRVTLGTESNLSPFFPLLCSDKVTVVLFLVKLGVLYCTVHSTLT